MEDIFIYFYKIDKECYKTGETNSILYLKNRFANEYKTTNKDTLYIIRAAEQGLKDKNYQNNFAEF